MENCRKQFGSAVPGDGDTRGPRERERKERHFRPIKIVKGRANRAREVNYSGGGSVSHLRRFFISFLGILREHDFLFRKGAH